MEQTGSFGGSFLGSLSVAFIAGVAYCIKHKFKHSDCALDSGCLKVSSHEDDQTRNTLRREILEELRKDGLLVPEILEVTGEPSVEHMV